ncbi:hypothetical protein EBS80_00755 [bacterium]|nr:hypothetical protein [bacterium]
MTFCEACHARLGMGERFAMSVAGPLAGFALAVPAAALCVFAKTDAMFLLASGLVVMNLLTSAANLLPVYPLDGGHATEAALRGLVGGRAIGEYAAIMVSGACLTALVGASVWYGGDINLVGRLNIAFNLLMLVGGNLARVMRSD